MFVFNFGTTTDRNITIISLAILWGLKSHPHRLITQSIIYCGQRNHETRSDRSPSPDSPLCVDDSCESSPSLRRSHIPVIVHSPAARLCSSATSHHTQPRRAAATQPWGRRHRPGQSLRHRRGPLMQLFRLLQMFSDSDRSEGAEEGRRDERRGIFPWGGELLFVGKQVGWLVMWVDSWQVQQRLTAKRRWQRGITEELSWGSKIFVDSCLVVGRKL